MSSPLSSNTTLNNEDRARLLYATFENIPIAIIAIDPSSKIITEWNPYATSIFGFSKEEAVGKTLDLILPEFMMVLAEHDQLIDKWLKSDAKVRTFDRGREVKGVTASGGNPSVRIKVFPVFSGASVVVIGAAIVDISEEVSMINELTKNKTALDEKKKELESLYAQSEDRNVQLENRNVLLLEQKAEAENARAKSEYRLRQLIVQKDIIYTVLSVVTVIIVLPLLIGIFSRVSETLIQANRDVLFILVGYLGAAITSFFGAKLAVGESPQITQVNEQFGPENMSPSPSGRSPKFSLSRNKEYEPYDPGRSAK